MKCNAELKWIVVEHMQYGFNTIMISAVNCFSKKTPSLMSDTVMNTPVVFIVDFAWYLAFRPESFPVTWSRLLLLMFLGGGHKSGFSHLMEVMSARTARYSLQKYLLFTSWVHLKQKRDRKLEFHHMNLCPCYKYSRHLKLSAWKYS